MFYRSYASPLGSRHKKKAFTLGSAEVRCECNSIWQIAMIIAAMIINTKL